MSEQFCHHCGESLVHVDAPCIVGGLFPTCLEVQVAGLRAQIDTLTALNTAECERDTAIRDLVRPVLGALQTDGDRYDVPSTVDLVEALTKQLDAVTADLDQRLAERQAQMTVLTEANARREAKEEKMREALHTYGRHLDGCMSLTTVSTGTAIVRSLCVCGLDLALASTKETP